MSADYPTLIERRIVHVLREPTEGDIRGVLVLVPDEDAMLVENVAVHPHHQGQGLGRRLLAFAEDQASAAGLRKMVLYTNERMTENIAYYQRLGYEEIDRPLDHGFRRVFMQKALP